MKKLLCKYYHLPSTIYQQGFTLTPKLGVTRRRQGGFTLMEALVATAVFAIAATSIVGVYLAVLRLNQASASLQALQQNGRFIMEDIAKAIRNGQIDYASYPGGAVGEPAASDLYLIDQDGAQEHIYPSGGVLLLNRAGSTTNFTGNEVTVQSFKVFVWPATNPFPGGTEQPTVTVYMVVQANVYPNNKTTYTLQTTVATRQYPQ